MNELMPAEQRWYQATLRWAVMVEGRGIREWKEAMYLFRSTDYDTAFQRALEIGEARQSCIREGTRYPRWAETRFAQVATLDCLGSELNEETELHWTHTPARNKIPFDYQFEPARQPPYSLY